MIYLKALLALFFILFSSCSNGTNSSDYPSLVAVEEYKLSIPEPSGITFGKDYNSFWIVSDGENGGIFQTNLVGETIQKLPFKSDDLEGISFDHQNEVLWVVEEQKMELVKVDMNGNALLRIKIIVDSDSKHGFEGIATLTDGRIWLTHEKTPRMLFMLNNNFNIENQVELNDAKDFSGLCFYNADSTVWLVSDESKLLIKWSISDSNILVFNIPVSKAEGVTNDFTNKMIYIVSDKDAKMYLFNLSENLPI